MYNQKYKSIPEQYRMDKSLEIMVSPVSLFLPLPPSPFQAEFPSGAQRLTKSTYLHWLLRPTREGAQGGAPSAIQAGPVAYMNRANLLS